MADAVALWLGERLLVGSLQGAVGIALVWLVCRFVPRIPAAVQAALWWLAALKLVLVFTPVPALPVALLPAAVSAETISQGTAVSDGTPEGVPYGSSTTRLPIGAVSWPQLLVMLWFAVVFLHAGRLLYAHRLLRAVVKRSVIWHGEETRELAERVGLARPPQVRLSSEIDTPQVCGLRNPIVLVPAETMATFTTEERAMVLCHELMHLRRRDLALGWVPACAERCSSSIRWRAWRRADTWTRAKRRATPPPCARSVCRRPTTAECWFVSESETPALRLRLAVRHSRLRHSRGDSVCWNVKTSLSRAAGGLQSCSSPRS